MVGLDFGTTNSSIAVAVEGEVKMARFADGSESYRSILYAEAPKAARAQWWTGPVAITQYLDADAKGRLIQSLKSFLASRSLRSTEVLGRHYTIEELIAILLRDLRTEAERQFGCAVREARVGRPVRFVGAETEADDAYAVERLRQAFTLAGFTHVEFELEPVAAAAFYAARLQKDEVLLVGDFGGGTSDFSLLRVGPGGRELLGNDGVGLAGDTFDARLIRHVVSPELGLGSTIGSMGKQLPVPVWLYSHLERWHYLSFLRSKETLHLLKTLPGQSDAPEKLQALYDLVNEDLGYRLHQAVQRTKRELSGAETAAFRFSEGSVDIGATVRRAEFEEWIAGDLAAIAACVDRLGAARVDRVFLTGGTSFVPAVRRIFAERFGAERIESGSEFTSIAHGLALGGEGTAYA